LALRLPSSFRRRPIEVTPRPIKILSGELQQHLAVDVVALESLLVLLEPTNHRRRADAAEPSLLAGLLVDAEGERFAPSHADKKRPALSLLCLQCAKHRGGLHPADSTLIS